MNIEVLQQAAAKARNNTEELHDEFPALHNAIVQGVSGVSDLFIAGQEMARAGDEFPIDGTNDLKLGWLDYTQTTERHERLLAKALNK